MFSRLPRQNDPARTLSKILQENLVISCRILQESGKQKALITCVGESLEICDLELKGVRDL